MIPVAIGADDEGSAPRLDFYSPDPGWSLNGPSEMSNGTDAGELSIGMTAQVTTTTGPYRVAIGFSYLSQSGHSFLPISGAFVELWIQLINGRMVQGNGYTDSLGQVIFNNVTAGRFAAVIYATDHSSVKVVNYSSSQLDTYEWWTSWSDISTNVSWTLSLIGTDRGAWAAFNDVVKASNWLKGQVNWSRSMVAVNWPTEDWPHSHGDYIDIPALTNKGDSIWDERAMFHEYGHCVHFASRNNSFPDIQGPDPHYIDSESNGKFAFVEGWAEFFENAVLGTPDRLDGTSLESTVYADGTTGHGNYGDWDGNEVEGAVANVLWDIYDGVSALDRPSWDTSLHGDEVDRQFAVLWKILLDERPEEMNTVWTLWPDRDAGMMYIFIHARFDKELSIPTNPGLFQSDHVVALISNDSTISVTWSGATDPDSGIAGYSILWDRSPHTVPEPFIVTTDAQVTSPELDEGMWYLHVRAIDGSGNAANGSFDIGPFVISSQAGDVTIISPYITPGVELEIILFVMLLAGAVLLIYIISRAVRRPRQEDVVPMVQPSWQFTYGQQPGNVPYHIPGQYAPPPPIPPYLSGQPEQLPGASPVPPERFCRNCGRNEMGGSFCPFCGFRLR
jgi:hypothetical protein